MPPPMYPATLALVDDDHAFSDVLTQTLTAQGMAVRWFADAEALLADPQAGAFEFYILDLMLPGTDGLALLRRLREGSEAGVLVVSGKLGPEVFEQVLGAGADMHLAKPVTVEQILLAVAAVYRRSAAQGMREAVWQLRAASAQLVAPDGAVIELSPTDVRVLQALAEACGETVDKAALAQRIGLSPDDDPNLLAATIYRLRRRIERATPALVPLQARSRQGYLFRGRLQLV